MWSKESQAVHRHLDRAGAVAGLALAAVHDLEAARSVSDQAVSATARQRLRAALDAVLDEVLRARAAVS